MRKAVILFIFLCIFFLFTFDVTVALNNEELEKIKFKEQLVQDERKNTILIRYKDMAYKTRAKITAMPEVEEQANVLPNIELLQIREGIDVEQLINELSKHESIETVELNHVSYTMDNIIVPQENLQGEGVGIYYDLLENRFNGAGNPSVMTVDNDSRIHAIKKGETAIAVKDSEGENMVFGEVQIAELPINSSSVMVNDIFYEKQWWLESVNVPTVWQKILDSKPVIVAVIDSGIDPEHEDLKNKLAPGGYNFIFNDHEIYDINGHGTAIAGIIAAETNNYKGIAGVSGPLDVKVLPLQAAFYDGTMYTSDMVRAITYAVDHNVDVINLSLGSKQFSDIVNTAIQEAISRGIIVVASSGNDGDSSYFYPASLQDVISVGAISSTGEVSGFSNYNNKVDFVAPGGCIFTTLPDNAYEYMDGTSFSAPIVSGIVSLMKSVNPSLTPGEITKKLAEDSLDKGSPGKDDYYGYGLINAYDTIVKLIYDVDADYIEFPQKIDVPIDKSWKITFNLRVDPQTVSDKQIYVKDSNNNVVYNTVNISKDGKSILITPLKNYDYGQEYCLYIESQIQSDTGIKLKKPVKMKFSTVL
ncbi:MAG TPA: S8 family serine peptidase [Oscillospiraceae bacterium]|nr:S8 family serine peptidase [Oscillospiraceae bacterium]